MRLLWLLRDITERTRAEEALRRAYEELEQRVRERTAALAAERNAVKRLAYSMSQDLRAPLVTLRGFANELRTTCGLLKAALPRSFSLWSLPNARRYRKPRPRYS